MNSPQLEIQLATHAKNIPSPDDFQTWANATLKNHSHPVSLCIRIVGPAEMQALNKQYRQTDKPTNVLSFHYEEDSSDEAAFLPRQQFSTGTADDEEFPLLGDIAICADVVAHEAQSQAKEENAHWAHLTIHGILHLLGYDHQTTAEADAMEALEIKLMKTLGFPNPYCEDTHE